jgi:hypothetical protein
MESWYRGNLKGGELVLLSEKGFTNNDLTLRWLRHYIQQKQCTPNSPYRLLLMDNHESHRTPEFILLANKHNIVLYPFLPHMTHCMQPLDVGVFHPYKHWHNKAIQYALENLDFEYTISSFLRDLPEIREKTMNRGTIKDAWKKAGMWPPNQKLVQKAMDKYWRKTGRSKTLQNTELELPTGPPRTPKSSRQVRIGLDKLLTKATPLLSSPSQREALSMRKGVDQLLAQGDVDSMHVKVLGEKIRLHMTKKPYNRRRVQKGGELTAELAHQLIEEKAVKEKEKAEKKETTMLKRIARKESIQLHRLGVSRRRAERGRKLKLAELVEGDRGASHLFIPIEDPTVGEGFQLLTELPTKPIEEPNPWGDEETMRRLAPFGINKGGEGGKGGGSDWNRDFIRFDDDSEVEIHIGTNLESSDSDSELSDIF